MKSAFRNATDFFLRRGPSFGPLYFLFLQGTAYCNLNCRYCYLPDKNKTQKMPLSTIEQIFRWIDQNQLPLAESQPLKIIWHAGEPLFCGVNYYREAFEKIDQYLGGRPHEHLIQTNGTLIDEKFCELFTQSKHPVKIGLSLDGPGPLHDFNRVDRHGRGTHQKVEQGLSLLRKYGINPGILSVVGLEALKDPASFYRYFHQLGARNIGLLFETPNSSSSNRPIGQEEDLGSIRDFLQTIFDMSLQDPDPIRWREFDLMLDQIRTLDSGRESDMVVEQRPFHFLNVAINGDFSTFSPDLLGETLAAKPFSGKPLLFGNVFKTPLSEVRSSKEFVEMNRLIQEGVRNCKKSCEYFEVCGGGSPYHKAIYNQAFDSTVTNTCRINVQTIIEILRRKSPEEIARYQSRLK